MDGFLSVSKDGRYLCGEAGQPVFLLCDTAWELFHQLDLQEAERYLRTRARQGFNAFFSVLLAEDRGLERPNAYGRVPLRREPDGIYDPCGWDEEGYSYWAHVDAVLDLAEQAGMYVGLLPCWGDKFNLGGGTGPEILTPGNARAFGLRLAERFGRRKGLIWILGGDRAVELPSHRETIRELAGGLRLGGAKQPIGFHPPGTKSSSDYFPRESWLDFHMLQSGHGRDGLGNAAMVRRDYQRYDKPVIDGEPRYEDHPVDFDPGEGFWTAEDACRAGYEAVFSGAFGHVYGHNSVWCIRRETDGYYRYTWEEALLRPGAQRVGNLRRLMERAGFGTLRPVRYGPDYFVLGREDLTLVYLRSGAAFMPLPEEAGGVAWWFDPADGGAVSACPAEGAYRAGDRDRVLGLERRAVKRR